MEAATYTSVHDGSVLRTLLDVGDVAVKPGGDFRRLGRALGGLGEVDRDGTGRKRS